MSPAAGRIALRILAAHRLRTALAMLGIFLGALALTTVLHVSRAMLIKADLETQKFGPNLVQVVAGEVRFRRDGGGKAVRTLTPGDARAVFAHVPGVARGVSYCAASMPVRFAGRKTNTQLLASPPEYAEVRDLVPRYGRFYTTQEEKRRALVCVLGHAVAARLFDDPGLAVGRKVFFFRAQAEVVGVMEEKGQDVAGTNLDEQLFVPLSTYMRRMANQDWISGVYLNTAPGTPEETVMEAVRGLLRERHGIGAGRKDDFTVLAARDAMKLRTEALELVHALGLISATVSFAVGSLGILSIMVLLVRARRLEIGVRRAVGASRASIVRQFLTESAVMAAVGGSSGVLAAVGLLAIVYAVGHFPFIYDPVLLGGTCLASAVLGAASGAYPAWEASRVDVLDVLRHPE